MSDLPNRRSVPDPITGGVAYASAYVYALEERLARVTAELEARKLDGVQMRLYMELHSQAMTTLLVSMHEPVSEKLAESLSNLSLRCRALHEHKTARLAGSAGG